MEKSISEQITRKITELYGVEQLTLPLTAPPGNIDADYSVPCFPAAKAVGKNPALIARDVAAELQPPEWIETVRATGPYLNVKLRYSALCDVVISQAIQEDDRFGHTPAETPASVLVEYSSPNTNKPLHLGHMRNNVLGMAVTNLLEARGHKVIPATILNDRGIHICKAMVAYREFFEPRTPETDGIKGDHFVGRCYVAFEREKEKNPALMDRARQMLRDWEAGDAAVIALWRKMNAWVYSGFEGTYRRMGSRFTLKQYESQTYKLGRKIAAVGLEKGVFFRKQDGSVWVDLTDCGLDEKAVVRADGTTLYITQDLGVAVERFDTLNPDRVIYVVGSEQNYHFKVLFEILRRLGYAWADQCFHLSYGMVYLPEGKMKSREGKVVDADELMDEMQAMALQIMDESRLDYPPDQRIETAEAIGVAAIKYYFLKVNSAKDIHFDPRASLSFEGATGAYIQYAFARIQSLLRKAGETPEEKPDYALANTPEEVRLVRVLMRFPSIVSTSADDLNPSRLAAYLWETAKAVNVVYHSHRILNAETPVLRANRLLLMQAAAAALNSGMKILGITPLQRM